MTAWRLKGGSLVLLSPITETYFFPKLEYQGIFPDIKRVTYLFVETFKKIL